MEVRMERKVKVRIGRVETGRVEVRAVLVRIEEVERVIVRKGRV